MTTPADPGTSPTLTALVAGYPRPQLVRAAWLDLGGRWEFGYDDEDTGVDDRWADGHDLDREILVPFPPESPASGIGDPGFHPVVWYRRRITRADLERAGLGVQGDRVLLHFGAVDYRADVWLDGQHLGAHEGGHTPFTFDVTPHVRGPAESWSLVVRAEDDPHDPAQPRGKQDWELESRGIWYDRTTGIWQPVWLEAVPAVHVRRLAWSADLAAATVTLDLELSARPAGPAQVRVLLSAGAEPLADVSVRADEPRSRTVLALRGQSNGMAARALLWSPEQPRLVEAEVTVTAADGAVDRVWSYLGLRSVGWAAGRFLINDRPCYLRAVLAQGYWRESHLAAPSADALRAEVQLIADLGFNAARVHQKAEDPRFLAWADRLGVLLWGEAPAAYEFSATAVERTTREWLDLVRRDVSHPSIVTWVPLNESWGIQHVAADPAQLAFAQALRHLTRALDGTRPVISNDGWEHAGSDLWTVHDYGTSGEQLAASYTDPATVLALMAGIGPLGRRMHVLDGTYDGQPVIVSEFGGVSDVPAVDLETSWGYVTTAGSEQYESLLRELFTALQSSPVLAGFCYTQLTDTGQETNGLADPQRRPKLPAERIRAIVQGRPTP